MRVSSSRLKAKFGQYMRAVRAGKSVIITDRDRPVARLVPFEPAAAPRALVTVKPCDVSAPPLGLVRVRAVEVRGTNTTEILLQDRRAR